MTQGLRMIVRSPGGPEAIEPVAFDLPEPGPGEVRVRHSAIGVNFIDTYHRGGLYPLPMPTGLGTEAAGVVDAIGAGVDAIGIGDRVAYVARQPGSYATHGVVAEERVFVLPQSVNDETAAACLLKGMTAEFLIERCARIHAGQTVLVHSAAGGVGSLLVQWLHSLGARVIAHSSSPAKAEAARALGADVSLCCPLAELPAAVRAEVPGGVEFVLDGVGQASWEASLASVARRGLIVTYGNASGAPPSFAATDLMRAGSIFVTRPTLYDYIATSEEYRRSAARLFEMIGSGKLSVAIGQRFPLTRAAEAHRAAGEPGDDRIDDPDPLIRGPVRPADAERWNDGGSRTDRTVTRRHSLM